MLHSEIKKRLYFLDNFRSTVILLVILLHTSIGYSYNSPNWWYAISPQSHVIFDIFSLLLDRIVMPLIFFVAGYFALYSIRNYPAATFIKKRLKRLGIPLILGIIFVAPIVIYIRHLFQQNINSDFFSYWIYRYLPFEITPVHLWFLISLIIFSIIFSIIYHFQKNIFELKEDKHRFYSSTTFLYIFGLIVSLGFFIIYYFISDTTWIVIQNFSIFQPTRFFLDISFFFLGITAYKYQWFDKRYNANNFYYWILSSVLIVGCTLLLYNYYYPTLLNDALLLFIDSILFVFLCISALMLILNINYRFFNKSSKFWDILAPNSYSIYIFHYPIVVCLQYYFINISIPIFIETIIIFSTSFALSFLFSQYIIKKTPFLKDIF